MKMMQWNEMLYSLSEHSDMLYAQIGVTDAKLRGPEQRHLDLQFRELAKKTPPRVTVAASDLDRGAPPEDRRILTGARRRPGRRRWTERRRGLAGARRGGGRRW